MKRIKKYLVLILVFSFVFTSCKSLKVKVRKENNALPETYVSKTNGDTTNSADLSWKTFFDDPYLVSLIDTALHNNQELNILLQEIEVVKNEIGAKKGEILPTVSGVVGAGVDKTSRYTRNGSVEANNDIIPGKEFPEPLQDYVVGFRADWEIDVWRKLRNSRDAAVKRYLATVEGQNFMRTNLITEIASEYYELLALDYRVENLNQNLAIQENALKIVKGQKESAKVTELAVKRFEAQLNSTLSLKYELQQNVVEVENRINFLLGRFPQTVERSTVKFDEYLPKTVSAGIPSQLLSNRTDVKQAELNLEAYKLDVKVARAKFYPSIGISAGLGVQAFNPEYILKSPESLIYSLAGDMVAPLLNRKKLKADFFSANAKQLQAVIEYEKTILNACVEVNTQLAKIDNLNMSYSFKQKEVDALNQSVDIANNLFNFARADYLEVLTTQREALESQFELIEMKKQQLTTAVNTYRALGGGWN